MWKILGIISIYACLFTLIQAQSYENNRCKCVCPSPSVVTNNSADVTSRKLYIGNVPPTKCDCDNVVVPQVAEIIKGKEQFFCPRCDCKYENRNITIIKVVVIICIWVISILVIYMLFLICLDPLLNKKVKGNYQEHTNEEDEAVSEMGASNSHQMNVRSNIGGNVLNRVGNQQDKWKRQVKEQRKNIYDKHSMLN